MLDLLFVVGVVFIAAMFILGVEVLLAKIRMSGSAGGGDSGEV